MFYHLGDSRHTQNIHINKVIGEHEKYVCYFTEKENNGLCGQLNIMIAFISFTKILFLYLLSKYFTPKVVRDGL